MARVFGLDLAIPGRAVWDFRLDIGTFVDCRFEDGSSSSGISGVSTIVVVNPGKVVANFFSRIEAPDGWYSKGPVSSTSLMALPRDGELLFSTSPSELAA